VSSAMARSCSALNRHFSVRDFSLIGRYSIGPW
jgi:hypothetical protein